MIRLHAALLTLVAGVASAAAQPATPEVVVLTSFPKELFEAYKQAFEQNHAVTYLRETRARPEADVFRVSAVDAFQTLKADGLLERVTLPRETLARMPARIGSFPLHDPDGTYWGFAVSG